MIHEYNDLFSSSLLPLVRVTTYVHRNRVRNAAVSIRYPFHCVSFPSYLVLEFSALGLGSTSSRLPLNSPSYSCRFRQTVT